MRSPTVFSVRTFGALAVALLLSGLARADGKVSVLVENDPLLTTPFGLDFLPDGSLVVADYDGHRVCKVAGDGKVSVLAGAGA